MYKIIIVISDDFKVTSITDWVAQLKINPLYAILSGFEVGNTPGVGTFYDFFNRLWDSKDNNLSPRIHPVKAKAKKSQSKGAKAAFVEKVTVFVAVAKRVFPNAAVTDTFPSLTVISDGILPETVGIIDMIYIC